MTCNPIKITLRLSALIFLALLATGCATVDPATMLPYGIDVAPNGNIVFVGVGKNESADLFILNPNSGKVTALTNTDEDEDGPAFDPIGTRVVYARSKTPNAASQIMVIPASGGKPIALTSSGPNIDACPRFSKDGKQIAFGRTPYVQQPTQLQSLYIARTPDSWDVHLMNSDGTNLRRVTLGKYRHSVTSPDFCQSDTKIVFSAIGPAPSYPFELNIVSISAKPVHPNFITNGSDCTCSPDGKSMVYISDQAVPFDFEVHILDLATKIDRQITCLKSRTSCPVFSKDGKRIFFLNDPLVNQLPDLWVVNVDGTSARKIASNKLFQRPLAWKKGTP